MIPKKSTPIKNEILINIFAKGLLNKDEMRVIFYIIRWSWGFNGIGRRQDWTKELTKRQIANDIEMDEGQFNRIINKMIIENKIIIKDGCFQFNEHFDKWKLDNLSSSEKLDKKSNKTLQKVKLNLIKSQVELDKKSSSIDPKPLQDKGLPDRKETLKETNTKETIKKLSRTFEKCEVVYQLTVYFEGKIRENNEAIQKKYENFTKLQIESQLLSWCKDMDKLIRLDKAKPNEIKKVINWVVEDKFWAKNILCPVSLRKHYPRFYKEVIDRGKSLEEKIETDHRLDDVD